jgi:drug/metabolite transporter (DMT)-like permease
MFLLAIRFLAAATLLALALPLRVFPLSKNAIISGCITGSGFGFGCLLLYLALPHIRAGKVTFLIALEVVIVPLICTIFYKQKISQSEKVAIIPAAIGLWLLCGDNDSSFSLWELVALLSAFAYSIYTISLSHVSNKISIFSRTFISFVSIGVFAFLASCCFEHISSIAWTAPTLAGLTYLVVFGSFTRFLLQAWAQKSVSASFTALTFSAEPVFTIALSYVFLGERFTFLQTIGAIAILSALLLTTIPLLTKSSAYKE